MAALLGSVGKGILLLLAGVGAAAAHAVLSRAVPPAGGTLTRPPESVSLWFSEALEPAFSRVEVLDTAGQRVDLDNGRVSADEPKRLTVGLMPLRPGTYTVRWQILSVDTHRTRGEYRFEVAR